MLQSAFSPSHVRLEDFPSATPVRHSSLGPVALLNDADLFSKKTFVCEKRYREFVCVEGFVVS
jgi:hypothetical protein